MPRREEGSSVGGLGFFFSVSFFIFILQNFGTYALNVGLNWKALRYNENIEQKKVIQTFSNLK